MGLARWMEANLATQGYCLAGHDARALRLGLRFPTAVCFVLVVVAVALGSWPLLLALSAVGLVAGFTPRHPFDLVWNHGVRHLVGAPEVPPNPTRRRHAFKVGTALLLVLAGLFAAGADTAALALGVALLAACASVTVANFCVPSALMALWERRLGRTAGALR
jgi:Domain of unknown function (DUF4395)